MRLHMKTKSSTFTTVFIFFYFLLSINTTKGQSAQKAVQQPGSIKFSGRVGHTEQQVAAAHFKTIPEKQLMEACSFFGGDSLSGFDFKAVFKEAEADNAVMFGEFRAFMFREQVKFVKNKYHLA